MSNAIAERRVQIDALMKSETMSNRLNALFAKNEAKAEKFKATLLNIALDKQLQDCSPASIVKSALMLAELDLPLSKAMGQCYIVRYKQDAEAVVGYKGWVSLAERSGKSVKVKPVFKCDEFEMIDNGFDETIIFKPNFDERKDHDPKWTEENLKGILVSVRDCASRVVSNTWVSLGKILQIAGKSPSRNSKFSPYVDWNLEMYQAKACKYVLSKTAMNEIIGRAVEVDNRMDIKAIEDKKAEAKADEIDLNSMLATDAEVVGEE